MKKMLSLILCLACATAALAQFQVSTNHRYLMRDGKPFFYLGDTAWELFHRLTREEADKYFKRRAAQGFTVIQAVILAEFDGLRVPNAYNQTPLENDNLEKPQEAYFKYVDELIDKADQYGLVIGLLPTWGDKVWKSSWGKGPEIFTPENAKIYGRFLGNRYKNRKNIIWILGGDRNPQNERHVKIWREMAAGITEGVGGAGNALMSFHPQPSDNGSSEWFHQDEWLDFNMFQNGHCRDKQVWDFIGRAYQKTPVKPVLDAEPIYEDHPVCFNANDLGTSSAYDVRKFAYLDLFSGACGHTYGCHDIWQFYSPKNEAVNGPHVFWEQALELPGANQMQFVRKLIESRPVLDRIPDQSLIVENNLAAAERIQATRGKDYAFVYSAAGRSFTFLGGKISGKSLKATWFDPRTGESTNGGTFENKGQLKFTPPLYGYGSPAGYGKDWILIVDDAEKNYPAVK